MTPCDRFRKAMRISGAICAYEEIFPTEIRDFCMIALCVQDSEHVKGDPRVESNDK